MSPWPGADDARGEDGVLAVDAPRLTPCARPVHSTIRRESRGPELLLPGPAPRDAFAQLTYRESLRDIEACLGALPDKLYHLGFRSGSVSRSTPADANEKRDWRIYADFAQRLVQVARRLYIDEPLGLDELDEREHTVYALDATTIDLCLAVFPWAGFRRTKAGVKMHTLLDLRGSIPAFTWVTEARYADVRILDELLPEPGSIYVFDRAFVDFARLHRLETARVYLRDPRQEGTPVAPCTQDPWTDRPA